MILLTTREHLAVEVEVGSTYGIIQVTCVTVNLSPLHHVAILSSSQRVKQLVSSLHKLHLTHDNILDIFALDALSIHLALYLEVRTHGVKILQRYLVIVGNGITQFCT